MTTATETPTKPRRLWIRFSLRTLLILVTVVAVLLGWVCWELEQVRKEQKATAWISEAGGSYSKNRWFGGRVSGRVRWVRLANAELSDLSSLPALKHLDTLFLSKTPVSDLSRLSEFKNLDRLFLDGTRVSDLSPLAELKNLIELDLSDTQVSDLSPLAELKNLLYLASHN